MLNSPSINHIQLRDFPVIITGLSPSEPILLYAVPENLEI